MRANVAALRAQGVGDQAIVDALDLRQQFEIPGVVPTSALMEHWGCSQPNVSRRLAAVHRAGLLKCSRAGRGFQGCTRITLPGKALPKVKAAAEQAPADWLARRQEAEQRAAHKEAAAKLPSIQPELPSIQQQLPSIEPAAGDALTRLIPGDVVRRRGVFYQVRVGPRPGVISLLPIGATKGLALDWPARSVEGFALVQRNGRDCEDCLRAG